ncbi:MAG TPA: response regulator transcription factor [Chloroflexota bacterium]|nr:response regulator transcription factor [Chloroflexota bacterium]
MRGEVLIVDDEPGISRLIAMYLEREGFQSSSVRSGAQALEAIETGNPSLVILDIMLPDIDGWDVCREIRRTSDVPIIMLTARERDEDKIVGLELGADDYVTKPFAPRELVARVKAILRRARPTTPAQPQHERLDRGPLTLFPAKREVTVDGNPVTLRAKEYDLLLELARRPGVVFSREKLLQDVWGYDFFGDSGTIDVHVRRLRSKLDDDSQNPRFIETVWGVGYRFKEQD